MKEVDACSCHINTLIYRYLIYVYSMRCHGIISRPYVYSYYAFHHYSNPHYFTVFHHISCYLVFCHFPSFSSSFSPSFYSITVSFLSINVTTNHSTNIYYTRSNCLAFIQLSPLFVHFSILGLVIGGYSFFFWDEYLTLSYFSLSLSRFFIILHNAHLFYHHLYPLCYFPSNSRL